MLGTVRRAAHRATLTGALVLPVLLGGCATPDDDSVVVATTSAVPSVSISTSSSTTRSPVAERTFVIDCVDGDVLQEPRSLSVSCDDSAVLEGMTGWQGWGEDRATSTGTFVENTCDPTCADGELIRSTVEVTLSELQQEETGQLYAVLTLQYTTPREEGLEQTEVYDLNA